MDTRRAFLGLALGAGGAALVPRTGCAQFTGGQQQQSQAPNDDSLQDRGAPTGRTGAATRGARSIDGEMALDLVAPLRGVGLTSVAQPELCYILTGRTDRPLRLAISIPGQARPLANFALPPTRNSDLGVVRLREHGVRLAPNQLCIWSVSLVLDPRAPSHDLVGTALIQYQLDGLAVAAANREAAPEQRVARLVRAGYWYDAVALAERSQDTDNGAVLAALFKQAKLPVVAGLDIGTAR